MLVRQILVIIAVSLAAPASCQEATSRRDQQLAEWLEKFPQADGNRDGVLTEAEVTAFKAQRRDGQAGTRATPTHADVRYGDHSRNVFDLYLPSDAATSDAPLPVFVFFHGGGFVGGDKSGFDATPYLNAGYAVVSGNYRFVDGTTTLSPAPMRDAARLIQYLKHHAEQWNLDPRRIALSGNSAGAVISMWIGYHDDLAEPKSEDPIERQSSRVTCIAPTNGPTRLDPKWITANMGGPKHVHGSLPKMFGVPVEQCDRPEVRQRILESSPFQHATADDPPTLMIYSGKNEGIPLPESASTGALIHHAYFGKTLADKLGTLGVEHTLIDGSDPRRDKNQLILDWLDRHL